MKYILRNERQKELVKYTEKLIESGVELSKALNTLISYVQDETFQELRKEVTPKEGGDNLLPRVGDIVYFKHGSSERLEPYTVTGFRVWKSLNNENNYRVFVVGEQRGHSSVLTNERLLKDVTLSMEKENVRS